MRFLLDTHLAVWLATERNRLTSAELDAIDNPDNEVVVSAVSIWELRIKWNRYFRSGIRKGPVDPARLLETIRTLGLPVEALTPEQAAMQLRDPIRHNDPFDDLLLALAQDSGRKLLTRDADLRGHPLAFHAD